MDLLVHFHLAAPVPPTGQHSVPGEVKEFFLPCILKYYKKKASFFQGKPHLKAAPLFIVFNKLQFVPPGFFTRLVPTLATIKHGQQLLYKIDFEQPVFRSRVTFSCQDPKVDQVTLTELPHAIKIKVVRDADPTHRHPLTSVCQKLLHAIEASCKKVHSCIYGKALDSAFGRRLQPAMEIKWEYALLCQSHNCPSHFQHYCYFTPGDSNLLCTVRTRQNRASQYYWMSGVSQ